MYATCLFQFMNNSKNSAPKPKKTSQEQYHLRQKQLVQFVDNIDGKVKQVLDHNQSEILLAYKLHFDRIKLDMDAIKMQQKARLNNSSSEMQQIDFLQKQVALFRKESLNLFQKLTMRQKTIQKLNDKVDSLSKENMFLCERIKQMMRKNKSLQGLNLQKMNKNEQTPLEFNNDQQLFIHRDSKNIGVVSGRANRYILRTARSNTSKNNTANNRLSNTINIDRNYGLESVRSSHKENKNQILTVLQKKFAYLDPLLLQQISNCLKEANINKNYTQITSRPYTASRKPSRQTARTQSQVSSDPFYVNNQQQIPLGAKQQMKQFFMKSVQTVKKQIARRKNINSKNFYKAGNPITIQQFKNMDFMRLMQIVFENQQIVNHLYQILIENK